MLTRRWFLGGMLSALAAPAILPPDGLMRLRGVVLPPVAAPPVDEILGPSYAELARLLPIVVRRAFLPRAYVQIYRAAPCLDQLLVDVVHDSSIPW